MTRDEHMARTLARLQVAEAEARDAERAIRFAADDLGAALRTVQLLRAELAAWHGESAAPTETARLVVTDGPCGRPEVTR